MDELIIKRNLHYTYVKLRVKFIFISFLACQRIFRDKSNFNENICEIVAYKLFLR